MQLYSGVIYRTAQHSCVRCSLQSLLLIHVKFLCQMRGRPDCPDGQSKQASCQHGFSSALATRRLQYMTDFQSLRTWQIYPPIWVMFTLGGSWLKGRGLGVLHAGTVMAAGWGGLRAVQRGLWFFVFIVLFWAAQTQRKWGVSRIAYISAFQLPETHKSPERHRELSDMNKPTSMQEWK